MNRVLREGHFAQGTTRGVVVELIDGWTATTEIGSATAITLIGACIAASGNQRDLVVTDVKLNEAELAACRRSGVPFVAASLWIENGHLLPTPIEGVTEHHDFAVVAHVESPPPESALFYEVGQLEQLYFEYDLGPCYWTFLGWFESPAEAAAASASAGMGLIVTMFPDVD